MCRGPLFQFFDLQLAYLKMEGEHQLQMKKAEKEKKKTGPQKITGSAVTEPDSLRCQTLQEENQVYQIHWPCQYSVVHLIRS